MSTTHYCMSLCHYVIISGEGCLEKEKQDVLGMEWEMFLGERDVHCPENGKGDV